MRSVACLGKLVFSSPCKVTDTIFILQEIEAQKGEMDSAKVTQSSSLGPQPREERSWCLGKERELMTGRGRGEGSCQREMQEDREERGLRDRDATSEKQMTRVPMSYAQ